MDKEKCEITGNFCECCNSHHHEDEEKENKTFKIALYIISIVIFSFSVRIKEQVHVTQLKLLVIDWQLKNFYEIYQIKKNANVLL